MTEVARLRMVRIEASEPRKDFEMFQDPDPVSGFKLRLRVVKVCQNLRDELVLETKKSNLSGSIFDWSHRRTIKWI